MRVAMLHFDWVSGTELNNLALLRYGIKRATCNAADWIITPETAVQGYFFNDNSSSTSLVVQPSSAIIELKAWARQHRQTLFISVAERDEDFNLNYNSCLVITADGRLVGRHRKLRSVGSAEQWATPGTVCQPFACSPLTAGVLICADLWHPQYAAALAAQGAQVLIVSAAWPPGECGPDDCWEERSRATGLPVWVANQTGYHRRLDFRQAESVVAAGGKTYLRYSGEPAVLLFDWCDTKQQLLSEDFTVLKMGEGS